MTPPTTSTRIRNPRKAARHTTFKDVTGQHFGYLTAQWPAGKAKWGTSWLCSCDCGRLTVALLNNLGRKTISCGCVRRKLSAQRTTKHGHTINHKPSRTHCLWTHMLGRCENPKHQFFRNYGGRGIKACERWRGEHGFENFLADMGERPTGMSLDRFPNNNGNYEPGNCRWATRKQQAANKRPITPEHCRNISIGKRRAMAIKKQTGKTS